MRSGRPLLRCDKPETLQKLLRRTSLPGPAPAWAANRRRRGKILGELSIPRPILTTIAQMADSEAAMNLLRKVPLFASLKDEDKVCIEETEEWRLPAGEMLVEEGKHAEYFFVLLEGEISVSKKHGVQEIVVALQAGRIFWRGAAAAGRPLHFDRARGIRLPAHRFRRRGVLAFAAALSGDFQ
jgi:Cyclic nucleotide-binding domain